MTEKQIQNAVLRAFATRPDMRIWRANAGVAVAGDTDKLMRLARQVGLNVRLVSFGVPGQADLTGIMTGGRRLEIELKTEIGRQSSEQQSFQAMIQKFGGSYVLARSVEDVYRALEL